MTWPAGRRRWPRRATGPRSRSACKPAGRYSWRWCSSRSPRWARSTAGARPGRQPRSRARSRSIGRPRCRSAHCRTWINPGSSPASCPQPARRSCANASTHWRASSSRACSATAATRRAFRCRSARAWAPTLSPCPGGTIVMTDGLVEAAAQQGLGDDALVGVLAHEIGHVVHRHTTRMLVEQAVLNVGLGLALGDVSSLRVDRRLAAHRPRLSAQPRNRSRLLCRGPDAQSPTAHGTHGRPAAGHGEGAQGRRRRMAACWAAFSAAIRLPRCARSSSSKAGSKAVELPLLIGCHCAPVGSMKKV